MAEIVFIGDDFTGASDSLATYARYGWRTSLLVDPAAAGGTMTLDAAGIPTDLRSLAPDKARRQLERLWPTIASIDPRIIHYKVCSTFDSSPETGSIGTGVSTIAPSFQPEIIAVIGGQPSLGRYSAFGNLFAKALDEQVYRIDRHPVMNAHPVTPMTEGSLMRHLAAQGLDELQPAFLPELSDTPSLVSKLRKGPVYFDAASDEDLLNIGRALSSVGGRQLLVGASSVAEILAAAAPRKSRSPAVVPPASPRLFVFAGSRSASTQAQIDAATAYQMVRLDPEALGNGTGLTRAAELLKAGHPVLAHLVPGADYGLDPSGLADMSVRFVGDLLDQVEIGYLGLAGGDTSSRICSDLAFSALDFWLRIDSGVCICITRHASPRRRNMRVMLKGGQMGEMDVFDRFAALSRLDRATGP